MKILFVCTGNTCRSPMAEARMNDYAAQHHLDIQASSAGMMCRAGDPMTPEAQAALAACGIHATHQANPLTLQAIEQADAVITMTRSQQQALQRVVPADKLYCIDTFCDGKELPDPYGMGAEVYRAACAQLGVAVERIAARWANNKA